MTTITVPPEHAASFRREAEATVRSVKDLLADSLRYRDDDEVDTSRDRLDAAERLCSTVEQNHSFEVDTPTAWWMTRQAVQEGLWSAPGRS